MKVENLPGYDGCENFRDRIHTTICAMSNFKHHSSTPAFLRKAMQTGVVLAGLAGLVYFTKRGFWDTAIGRVRGDAATSAPGTADQLAAANRPTQAQIGMNVGGIADWATQWPFVDLFKTSREWIPQREGADWGKGEPLQLTSEGWVASLAPGQYAETVMMIDTPHYPSGKYTLLYEGEGKITLRNAAIASETPGKMVVDVKADGAGVFLQIRETNPSNPIRNIRFIMPGFEQTYKTQPFHPLFLERLSKFQALRFMDWGGTNNSKVVNWADRTTLTSARQSNNGVALEHMIQLANTLKIDPWFTIPAKASDDYVRQFAKMVRDRLDPSLTIHIEYSNEIWNTIFEQFGYALEQGKARNLGAGDDYLGALRFYSERSVQVFKIVQEVFGSSADRRIVRVLAGQAGNPWTGEQILGWKDAYKQADAYAIAPYFDGADLDGNGTSDLNDPKAADKVLSMTPDQAIDNILQEIPNEIKQTLDKNYAIATTKFGLPLYAYEGGPHLTAYQFPEDKVERITALFTEVNRHPRMREVYRQYLNQWKQSGGGLFNQFVDVAKPSKWGFWGAMEYQNQDLKQAPKYQGLIDFIDANPPR
ncbi:MAG: hypothetical protein IGS48_10595 [Oscillatoriales cyanobacterium C42_A2020_001]|nr:hypothetical protein [Leptolyngbyaceae cyanobacterium C42_A2020_001]